MRYCSVASALLVAGVASAQVGGGTSGGYTFEMRLIADGDAGAPAGPGATYPLGNPANVTATRIGFWLQARVLQTEGQNWGVVRASSPAGGTSASYITLADPVGGSSLGRGSVNAANTIFGRGSGYRTGGTPTGQSDNAPGNDPFPFTVGNQNGGLDNGGSGAAITRIYAFDSYVGSFRNVANPDEPSQPWNVNGAPGSGSPVAPGVFSPWASIYRIWVDIASSADRTITISASALLSGATQAAPTDASQTNWAMQVNVVNGVNATAFYTVHIPSPAGAAVLGLGGLAALRRRR